MEYETINHHFSCLGPTFVKLPNLQDRYPTFTVIKDGYLDVLVFETIMFNFSATDIITVIFFRQKCKNLIFLLKQFTKLGLEVYKSTESLVFRV